MKLENGSNENLANKSSLHNSDQVQLCKQIATELTANCVTQAQSEEIQVEEIVNSEY